MSKKHESFSNPFGKIAVAGVVLSLFALGSCSSPEVSESGTPQSTQSASAPTDAESGEVSSTSSAIEEDQWPVFVVESTPLKSKLEAPWSVVQVGTSYVVSLRDSGEIIEVTSEQERRPLASFSDFNSTGEGGLLGLAYSEDFGLFAYVSRSKTNEVVRFDLSTNSGGITLGAPVTVFSDIAHGSTHNGGRLAFGPDEKLYVSTGDAGIDGGLLAQDPQSTAGKILRINPDGSIPDDNPVPESPVWSLGHRNVQGMAWSSDGTMFATEFGAQTWDELNIVVAGGNYGWPEVEGIAGVDGYTDPVQQWATAEASPSGLTVIDDVLYLANLRGESIRSVPVSNPNVSELIVSDLGRVRDVLAVGPGRIVALTNNTDGRGNPSKDDDLLIEFTLSTSN